MRPIFDAVFFVCAIALGEMAYWTYTKEITHYRVIEWDFLWMLPIAYAILAAGITALGYLVRGRTGRWPVALIVTLFTFVGLTGWLRIGVKSLHPLACAILALGIGIQLGRLVSRHVDFWRRFVNVATPIAVLLVAVPALVAFLSPRWVEHRQVSALPPSVPNAPNVLLIVLDTVRADAFVSAGYSRATTPNLDAFAKRGTTFSRALSTSPWTLPSHASMFTGTLPHDQAGGWMSALDSRHTMLAEVFARSGYLTSGFVANSSYGGAAFGLARGFAHYEGKTHSLGMILTRASFVDVLLDVTRTRRSLFQSVGRKTATAVGDDFLSWLRARDRSRPYFAFLNYFDAHAPYFAPSPFATAFSGGKTPANDPWRRPLDSWNDSERLEFRNAYDGALAYIDHEVGRLLASLEALGELSHTVVVITADHGEQFGEHNLMEHSNSLYLPLLHVPLMIVSPGQVPAGRRIDEWVSLRNLPATVLDLAQLPNTAIPGQSMASLWSAAPAQSTPVLSEVNKLSEAYPSSYPARRGRMESVLFGDYHFIVNLATRQEELYRIGSDPAELTNLAASEPAVTDRYRKYFDDLARNAEDSRKRTTARLIVQPCATTPGEPEAVACATVPASQSFATRRQR